MNKIAILISTYNGEKYIQELLTSIFSQTYKNIEVIVRDDLSTDNTVKILENNNDNILLLSSEKNLGVINSFETLLNYALENTNSKYFMFCDQDDIWEEDKVESTLKKMLDMSKENINKKILVHTDLTIVNEKLIVINKSMMNYTHVNPTLNSLNRLLIQNTITGCTVMINRQLAQKCLPIPNNCIMHDWWIGLVASEFGEIGYVEKSTIKYRQHDNNVIGVQSFNLFYIIKMYFGYTFSLDAHCLQAKEFLNRYKKDLSTEKIELLENLIYFEKESFIKKRFILIKNRFLNQGIIRNIGLLLKV